MNTCFLCAVAKMPLPFGNEQPDFDLIEDAIIELMVTPLLDSYYAMPSCGQEDLATRCASYVAIGCPDKACGKSTCVYCAIASEVGAAVSQIVVARGDELRWYAVERSIQTTVEAVCDKHKRVGVVLTTLHEKRKLARRRSA